MKKKKSVVYIWIISYLLVLLVPIVFNMLTYVKYESVLNEQVNKKNESILQNKSKLVDDCFQRAYQLAEMNYSQPQIIEFSQYEQPFSVEQQYKIYSFTTNWFNYLKQTTDYITNVYVYLPKSDTILSQNPMPSRRFFRANYNGTEEEYIEWKNMLDNNMQKEFYPLSMKGNQKGSVFYVMGASELLLDVDSPKTVIEISNDVFSIVGHDEYSGFYVVDSINKLVYGEDELWREVIETGECKSRPDVAVNKFKSQETGITYIFMQDKTKYLEVVKNIRLITDLVIIFCIIVGIVIISYAVNYNSRPMNSILKSIGYKKNDDENEFQYISKTLKGFIQDKENKDNIISMQNKYLRGDLFIKLLTNSEEVDERLLNSFGINFAYNSFLTAMICINPNDDMFFEHGSNETAHSLALYAVENIINEVLPEAISHYTFTYSGIIHCIINCDEDCRMVIEEVKASIKDTNQFVKKNLNFTLTGAISDMHFGIRNLPKAYRQVKNILEYRFIKNDAVVLESDVLEQESKNSKYAYSLQNEQRAINSIKSGDYVQAVNILNEVLDISEDGKYMSLPLIKLLVFNILSTLMRACEEIGIDNREELFDKEEIYNRVVYCTSISQVQEEVEKTLNQFEEAVKTSGSKSSFVAKRAKEYIEANYTNQDISVSSIAEVLNITPNYMSQVYKKEYGIGLLEYLSKLRIQDACRLLVETNMSLEQIATCVGFSNARSLSRSFLKNEGLNPGKYRLAHGMEDEHK